MGAFGTLDGLRDSAGGVVYDSDMLAACKAAPYPERTVLISLALVPDEKVAGRGSWTAT